MPVILFPSASTSPLSSAPFPLFFFFFFLSVPSFPPPSSCLLGFFFYLSSLFFFPSLSSSFSLPLAVIRFSSMSTSPLSSAHFPSFSFSYFSLFLLFLLRRLFLPYLVLSLVASSFRIGFSFLLKSFPFLFFLLFLSVFRLSFLFPSVSVVFHSAGFFIRSGVCFLSPRLLSPLRLFSSAGSSSVLLLFLVRYDRYPLAPVPLPLLFLLPLLRYWRGGILSLLRFLVPGFFSPPSSCGSSSWLVPSFFGPSALIIRFCSACSSPFAVVLLFVLPSSLWVFFLLIRCRSPICRLVLLSLFLLPACLIASLAGGVFFSLSFCLGVSAALVTLFRGCLSGGVCFRRMGARLVLSHVRFLGYFSIRCALRGFPDFFAFLVLSYVYLGLLLLCCDMVVCLFFVVTASAPSL